MKRFSLYFLVTLLWAAAAGGSVLAAEAIAVTTRPVQFDLHDPERTLVGKLVYRGGLALSADHAAFGGWSDLRVTAGGRRMTAISDRGSWIEAELLYNGGGNLKSIGAARIGLLIDVAGAPVSGSRSDAEGLAREPDGSWLVSFERRHRLWRYPAADPPFSRPPQVIPPPPGLDEAPSNRGLEALIRLAGGMLFALTEELIDAEGYTIGWIGDGTRWDRLRYKPATDFKPTGAAELPDGDVLVLERRFTVVEGPGARIVRLPRAALVPGATLTGKELAVIESPLAVDNFEGIDARKGPAGETLIYLISDDNFSIWQRTLLLMFELPAE